MRRAFFYISNVILSIGLILYFICFIIWLKTGAWQQLNVAMTLSAARIPVPPPPTASIAQIYDFVGQSSLAVCCVLIGFVLSALLGKRKEDSWMKYPIAVITSPVKIVTAALDDLFSALKFMFVTIASFVFIMICLTAGFFIIEYAVEAKKYSGSPNCDELLSMFNDDALQFVHRCIDVGYSNIGNSKKYFVFFMASEPNPGPENGRTGHAWIATAEFEKIDNIYNIMDYHVTGYGMAPGSATCQQVLVRGYSVIRNWLPVALTGIIEQFYCLNSQIQSEGPAVDSPNKIPISPNMTAQQVDGLLGRRPAVLLAASVNSEQYNNVKRIIANQKADPRPYQLMWHDCTSFVRDIAAEIGLYSPPRLLYPFPSQNVYAFTRFNYEPKQR